MAAQKPHTRIKQKLRAQKLPHSKLSVERSEAISEPQMHHVCRITISRTIL